MNVVNDVLLPMLLGFLVMLGVQEGRVRYRWRTRCHTCGGHGHYLAICIGCRMTPPYGCSWEPAVTYAHNGYRTCEVCHGTGKEPTP